MQWLARPAQIRARLRSSAAALSLLLLGLATTSCDVIDGILESPTPAETMLRIGWLTEVDVTAGQTHAVPFVIARLDGYKREVNIAVLGLPAGVTASVASTNVGENIQSTITFVVAPTVAPGTYPVTLRVRGDRLKEAARTMNLSVLPPPSYSLAVAPAEVRLVRGGAIPVAVAITRLNFTEPVTLALDSDAAITATFGANPVTGAQATALVQVGDAVAPGTYTVSIHGTPGAAAAPAAELSVVVLPEDLQVIAGEGVTALQGRTARQTFIVNSRPSVGAVTLDAQGVPDHVTVAFTPVTGNEYAVTFAVSPLAPVGTFPITIRATAPGVPDASAVVVLTIDPSSITVAAVPSALSVFQGTRATALIAIHRTNLDTSVAFAVASAPAGLTVTIPSQTTGIRTTLSVEAVTGMPPGSHTVTIAATPHGWPADAAVQLVVPVEVRPAPAGTGNVILDWGQCGNPIWAASQDGTGPWTRVTPINGAARTSVFSGRGGVAFIEPDGRLVVRFLTTAEFTDFPEQMCPPATHTAQMTGTGLHAGGETVRYGFGGATATSSALSPTFSLAGIAPGVHDLVAWATGTLDGTRGLIRRDLVTSDGASLGEFDILGAESVLAATAPMTISGALTSGNLIALTVGLQTRDVCTFNSMFTQQVPLNGTTTTSQIAGFPASALRPGDMHLGSISVTAGNRVRTSTFSFAEVLQRAVVLGPNVNTTPALSQLSGNYRRLHVVANGVSGTYDGMAVLNYAVLGKQVSLQLSRAYLGASTNMQFGVPDFTGVSGWSDLFAPSLSGPTEWTITFSGGSTGSPCTPGYATSSIRFNGVF